MKYFLLTVCALCVPMWAYGQLDVQDDKQIMWGFVEFASRFMLYATGLVCVFTGFMYMLYSPKPRFLKRRRRGHRHQGKPRTTTIKKRVFYRSIFWASLGASIFLAVLAFVSAQNMR